MPPPWEETIEVSSGTYQESLVIDRSLILKGISSGGTCLAWNRKTARP